MEKTFIKNSLVIALILMIFLLAGCDKSVNQESDLSLKIGIMPAVDSAPILLAEKKGYFEELGLEMDIELYRDANNRQSGLQSGELDGTMTDLIAFVNNVQNGFDIKITTSTDGVFPFLVNKDFQGKFQDNDEVKIGIMEVSVSNFLSEEFLGDKYKLDKLFITAIPTRLEMIIAGQVDMAIIPEPMASMGQLRGLEKLIYENKDDFMPEAMVFTVEAIKNKEKAISLFHQGYNKAVRDIQEDDELARDLLISHYELDPAIREMIVMPEYHLTRLPAEEYMVKIVGWVEEIQGKEIDIQYEEMIERKFSD